MNPGDVVLGILVGAHETKIRPAVVIASATYLAERPDVLVGILTTKLPNPPGKTDHILRDWAVARLRAESCFRAYVLTLHRSELTTIGHLSARLGIGSGVCSHSVRYLTPASPSRLGGIESQSSYNFFAFALRVPFRTPPL